MHTRSQKNKEQIK